MSIIDYQFLSAEIGGVPTYELAEPGKNDMEAMRACCEAESKIYWSRPEGSRLCAAPFYFERLAILCRRAKDYSGEVSICEQWKTIISDYKSQALVIDGKAALVHEGGRSEAIISRLKKARELLARKQAKP